MLKQGLWAGLLGVVVNIGALLVHGFREGTANVVQQALGTGAIVFPFCFVHGLLIASLLRDLQVRGASRATLAAVGLLVGALIAMIALAATMAVLFGLSNTLRLLTSWEPENVGLFVLCLATGAASALGALIGMRRTREGSP